MIRIGTIHEFFRYNDWARDALLPQAARLSDAQLDRPFEMGEGSLRATLRHLYGSERTWYTRAHGSEPADCPPAHTLHGPDEILQAQRNLASRRDTQLARATDADMTRVVTYTNPKGETYSRAWGDILLHQCNHGVHHRAQALNMLRRVGGEPPKPGLDYVFMKLQETEPPPLDVDTLQTYFAYADWARDRVHGIAATLTDEQLDRKFDLGHGSLRATLLHIRLAEEWWYGNWTDTGGRTFPASDERPAIVELARLFAQTAAKRNALFGRLTDADLRRPITVTPRPGVTRVFPLGVSMLQLCCHGTHHRAHALNMLRHVGAEVPGLDYVAMLRERAGAQ